MFILVFLIIFTIHFVSISSNENQTHLSISENILKWAITMNISISPKITLNYTSTNNKYFYTIEDINENDTILSMPYETILSPERLYELSPKKLHKVWNKINSKNSTAKNIFRTQSIIEQSFMAICQYFAMNRKNKNNLLYKLYGAYYETYEENLDHFPLMYTEEELTILEPSQFAYKIKQSKTSINEEAEYFIKNMSISSLIHDDYLKYRILSVSKSYNINNKSSIVPLSDFFPIELHIGNVKWKFINNTLTIFANRNLTKGEKLYMKGIQTPNSRYLMFYGKTFDNNSYIEPFHIPLIHPRWRKEENVTLSLYQSNFDLSDDGFIGHSMESYKIIGSFYNMPSNDDTGYIMILKNLKYFQEDYENIQEKDFYKKILLNENRINVKRVIELEKLLIKNRVKLLEEIVEDRKNRRKKRDL